MIDAFQSLPLFWMGLIIVGGWMLLSLAALSIIRPRLITRIDRAYLDPIDNLVPLVATAYVFIAGFLLVSVWSDLQNAHSIAGREAASLIAMYQDARAFPVAERRVFDRALRRYVVSILNDEWPAMKHGDESLRTREALVRLADTYTGLRPTQSPAYTAVYNGLNDVTSLREQRIQSSGASLLPILWLLVLGIGLVATLASFFMLIEPPWIQTLLVGALAVTIGSIIFLITAINHPYSGDLAVSKDVYQHVLEVFSAVDRG